MLVKNLVSWAGDDFSHLPGDVIDLPDDVAEARVAEGLADYPPPDEPVAPPQPASRGKRAGA